MSQQLKIVFAPGCLEAMEQEMSPEELQQLMDEFKQKLDDGSLFEESEPVDFEQLKTEDPELYALLMERLEEVDLNGIEPPTSN